ncbi:hypothetical protein [Methylocystis iwaonis]|nr:hypothetical protein [Methylocystis iwaonis]
MSDERRGDIEIIPPGQKSRAEAEDDGFPTSRVWISSGQSEIKFVKLGPFQSMLVGAGLLLFVGLCLFFLSGLLLILVPAVALLGAGAWVANALGLGPFRRLR